MTRDRFAPSELLTTGAWLAPIVAALCLAFPSGGYFITSWGVASILLLALLATCLVAVEVSWGGPLGATAVAGWVGLAAWQGLSAAWAYQPSAAINAMNQTLLYAAAFALVLIGVRRAADLTWLMHAALLGSAAVAVYALGSRLVPSLVSGDEQSRLSTPISYWNGLGAIVAFGAVLAIAGAGHPYYGRAVRAAHGALVPVLLLVLLLTFSRGALLALIVGLVVLVAIAPGRLETVATMIGVLGISVPLLVFANAQETVAVFSGPLPPPDGSERWVLLLLGLTMVGSAGLTLLAKAVLAGLSPRTRSRAALAIVACVVVGVAVPLVATPPAGGPAAWTERQVDSFKAFDAGARAEADTVADRLAVAAGSGRWQNWQVAADQFGEEAIAGTGAGDYRFFWEADRTIDLTVRNAHSLYLETLAESGLIGLALLLVPITVIVLAVATALWRRPRVDAGVARGLGIAVAASAVIGVHLAGDWDWQLPAVVLPAVALSAGALAVATKEGRATLPSPSAARWASASVGLVAIALVMGPLGSAVSLNTARGLAASGELEKALDHARRADALDPWSPTPSLLAANLLADLERPDEADRAFARAASLSPRDWTVFADWSFRLIEEGRPGPARVAARAAAERNPLDPRPRYLLARASSRAGD